MLLSRNQRRRELHNRRQLPSKKEQSANLPSYNIIFNYINLVQPNIHIQCVHSNQSLYQVFSRLAKNQCCRAWDMLILFAGLITSSFCSRSSACSGIPFIFSPCPSNLGQLGLKSFIEVIYGQSASLGVPNSSKIIISSEISLVAKKRGFPKKSSAIKHPTAHTSTFQSQFDPPIKIQGALYHSVEIQVVYLKGLIHTVRACPKSQSFSCPSLEIKKLCGLRSLCITPFPWRQLTADSI